eukprot:TRINITY_DN21248_c0_g1_i1.p1 TRINITY_DN21248_c0_g1~~TRINITY_DN21248_c0_g1_i1.p1  ORF type:complete len:432 (-),score=58.75 TRINITY_DN21248_c0_g1_i1:243-1538(-)
MHRGNAEGVEKEIATVDEVMAFAAARRNIAAEEALSAQNSTPRRPGSSRPGSARHHARLITRAASAFQQGSALLDSLTSKSRSHTENMVVQILKSRVDPNVRLHEPWDPIFSDYQHSLGGMPLHFAARRGFLQVCKSLIEHKAMVNGHDTAGRTPLMLAVMFSRRAVIQALLAERASAIVQDEDGLSALDLAELEGDNDIISMLKQAQAEEENEWHHVVEQDPACLSKFLREMAHLRPSTQTSASQNDASGKGGNAVPPPSNKPGRRRGFILEVGLANESNSAVDQSVQNQLMRQPMVSEEPRTGHAVSRSERNRRTSNGSSEGHAVSHSERNRRTSNGSSEAGSAAQSRTVSKYASSTLEDDFADPSHGRRRSGGRLSVDSVSAAFSRTGSADDASETDGLAGIRRAAFRPPETWVRTSVVAPELLEPGL